jgi:hypothetical protein
MERPQRAKLQGLRLSSTPPKHCLVQHTHRQVYALVSIKAAAQNSAVLHAQLGGLQTPFHVCHWLHAWPTIRPSHQMTDGTGTIQAHRTSRARTFLIVPSLHTVSWFAVETPTYPARLPLGLSGKISFLAAHPMQAYSLFRSV